MSSCELRVVMICRLLAVLLFTELVEHVHGFNPLPPEVPVHRAPQLQSQTAPQSVVHPRTKPLLLPLPGVRPDFLPPALPSDPALSALSPAAATVPTAVQEETKLAWVQEEREPRLPGAAAAQEAKRENLENAHLLAKMQAVPARSWALFVFGTLSMALSLLRSRIWRNSSALPQPGAVELRQNPRSTHGMLAMAASDHSSCPPNPAYTASPALGAFRGFGFTHYPFKAKRGGQQAHTVLMMASKPGDMQYAEEAGSNLRSASPGNPGSSIAQSVFNLVKNVVGAGVLSLSSGVAGGTGLVPAGGMVICIGVYSMASFMAIGKMCKENDALTFAELGDKTKGKGFARTMTVTCALKTFLVCLTYSVVVTDSVMGILSTFAVTASRQAVLLTLTALIFLPLCLIRNLSLLSYTSLMGSAGLLYTLIFMSVRFLDGSYLPGGQFYNSVAPALRPDFSAAPGLMQAQPSASLYLLCLLSTALEAHYNAPRYWEELANRSERRFNVVTFTSFTICIVFCLAFMLVGYLTFGTTAQGMILNNYSAMDPLATISRIAIASSIVLTFPLIFTGLRDSVTALLQPEATETDQGVENDQQGLAANRNVLTLGLLGAVTSLALVLTDVGFLNALGGSVFGALIIYIFPGLIMVYYARQPSRSLGRGLLAWAKGTVVWGVLLGILGTSITIMKQFTVA